MSRRVMALQSLVGTVGFSAACSLAAYQVGQGTTPLGHFVILLTYWSAVSSQSSRAQKRPANII